MELRAAAAIPVGAQWLYEPKWDGYRCLAHRDGEHVTLLSKNGQPLTRYFPEIVAALGALSADGFSLDGELVVPAGSVLSFDALQQRIHPAASRIAMLARTTPARYVMFDLLRAGGIEWVDRPLAERRRELERFAHAMVPNDGVRLSPATTNRNVVDAWFAQVGGALDGVVAKRLDAKYLSGSRDGGFKIKQQRTADCVIGGFRYVAGTRDAVASLLLGLYDAAGRLDHVGFCSAFPTPERRALLERLAPAIGGPGFTGNAPGATPSRWNRDPARDRSYVMLHPTFVLEVGFDQVTSGRIRHAARALRWRTDKSPQTCTGDQLELPATAQTPLDL